MLYCERYKFRKTVMTALAVKWNKNKGSTAYFTGIICAFIFSLGRCLLDGHF